MDLPTNRTDIAEFLARAIAVRTQGSSDFDLNPDYRPPAHRKLRPAAVLVPVIATKAGPRVLLTKRASGLKHHPGQIAFPGGKLDDTDADARAAALREASEEIGLPPSLVEVIGELPTHETVTGFSVTPVLGVVRAAFSPKAQLSEVAEIFDVPLAHVAATCNFSVQARRWRGNWRRYYTVPWGPYYIWGATARICRNLAEGVEAVCRK